MTGQIVFRFKFTQDVMDELSSFAKVHQYDDRHSYKEEWDKWCKSHTELVQNEMDRLERLGYDGDVLDKMYKSARYYFRKKEMVEENQSTPRRNYIPVNRDFITRIDAFIRQHIGIDNFTPADGFNNFCENNKSCIFDEVNRIKNLENVNIKDVDIADKIKKTYKNRHFICVQEYNNKNNTE